MELSMPLVITLILMVAILYSSVGHGGASGYQAILAIAGFSVLEMASIALILNLVVAGMSFANFKKGRYFSWELTWPFIVASIPAAFLGAWIRLPTKIYVSLLSVALLISAVRLLWVRSETEADFSVCPPRPSVALMIGGALGFVSGMLGVGGGIFLSPILLCFKWGNAKYTAATSALFILVNAASGLIGRFLSHNLIAGEAWQFVPAVIVGGFIGSALGAYRFKNLALCRLLALVLFVAVSHMIFR